MACQSCHTSPEAARVAAHVPEFRLQLVPGLASFSQSLSNIRPLPPQRVQLRLQVRYLAVLAPYLILLVPNLGEIMKQETVSAYRVKSYKGLV